MTKYHTRIMMPSALAFGPFLLWLSGAMACGGSEPAASAGQNAKPPASAASGSAVVAQAKIDRCAGVSAADLASIVGTSAADIETTNLQQHGTLRICGYAARSGSTVASFSLSWEESVEESKEQFVLERQDLGLANRVVGSATGSKAEESAYVDVLGLGDDAFWTPVNGTLVTRVGNVRVQIMMPRDRPAQTAVAQLVVKGLR